jgi:hypothetical protein
LQRGRAAGPGDFAISRILNVGSREIGLPEGHFHKENAKPAKKRKNQLSELDVLGVYSTLLLRTCLAREISESEMLHVPEICASREISQG